MALEQLDCVIDDILDVGGVAHREGGSSSSETPSLTRAATSMSTASCRPLLTLADRASDRRSRRRRQ